MRFDERATAAGGLRPRVLSLAGVAIVAAALALSACGDDADDGGGSSGETATDAPAAAAEVAFEVPEGYRGPEAGLPTEYPEPESCEGLTIGWQNPLAANVELRAQQQAVELEVQRLGGKVIALDDEVDPNKQVSNMQQLLAQDVDAIGFLPIDPKATEPVLEQAAEANTPVLAIEKTNTRKQDPGQIATQIWRGRDIQAYNQARYMADVKPGARIAVIGFAVPVPGIDYLEDRESYWAEQLGLDVVAFEENQTDDSAGGQKVGNAVLTANPDLEGVIAYNDPTALGVSAAARAAGLAELTVIGLNGGPDGFEGVRSGQLAATFQQDSVGTGIQAARALCALGADPNADIPKLIVRPPSGAITAENVEAAKSWEEQLDELRAR